VWSNPDEPNLQSFDEFILKASPLRDEVEASLSFLLLLQKEFE
jgi:hypothetical protein